MGQTLKMTTALLTHNDVFSMLDATQTRMNTLLKQAFQSQPDSQLKEAMCYSLSNGGKRIRPLLIFTLAEMFQQPIERFESSALAIEFIHTYSLIHDDLPAMDNDDLRRGQPTCHRQFDEAQAILAGDALQSEAFCCLANDEKLSSHQRIQLIQVLARASGLSGMCLGQSLDLIYEHHAITLETLNHIHQHKTGALLQAAVEMALIVIGEPATPYRSILCKYSQWLGLAFQIQDDILDVTGDPLRMGKSSGMDQQLEKSTYPALMGLASAQNELHTLQHKMISLLESLPFNTTPLRHIVDFIVTRDH